MGNKLLIPIGKFPKEVYNTLKRKLRSKNMPIFVTQLWNEYQIRLVPSDYFRNLIREILLRHDVIPYFYGPLTFDLAVAIPRGKSKLLSSEIIRAYILQADCGRIGAWDILDAWGLSSWAFLNAFIGSFPLFSQTHLILLKGGLA